MMMPLIMLRIASIVTPVGRDVELANESWHAHANI
jgi:hypothetical protein